MSEPIVTPEQWAIDTVNKMPKAFESVPSGHAFLAKCILAGAMIIAEAIRGR